MAFSAERGLWGGKDARRAPKAARRAVGQLSGLSRQRSVDVTDDLTIGLVAHPPEDTVVVVEGGHVSAVIDAHADTTHRTITHDGVEDTGVGRAEAGLPVPVGIATLVGGPADARLLVVWHN